MDIYNMTKLLFYKNHIKILNKQKLVCSIHLISWKFEIGLNMCLKLQSVLKVNIVNKDNIKL